MTNFLSFNCFKTKSFKVLSLVLALSGSSGLLISTNHQSVINSVNDSNKLSGFHITVKQNNKNLVSEANTWNVINKNYEDFIRNHKEQLITEQFDDWTDIIDQVNGKPSDDHFSKDVNSNFMNQIKNKENNILPDNDNKYFTDNNIVGRSIAKRSLNNIPSFGDVYVNYHDNSLQAQINNGLFATINPKAEFDNYFSIPYNIKPSAEFLKSHTNIEQRVAVLPLNNSSPNVPNQSLLVILVKKDKEQLLIKKVNGDNENVIDSGGISYAVLSHNPNDGFKSTNFNVTVKDTNYDKSISLTNNSSDIQFNAITSSNNKVKTTEVAKEYLVQNNNQNNQNTLIVMNEAVENVKVNLNNPQQNWLKWNVDAKTLQKVKGDPGERIKDGQTLPVNPISDFQVYCIGLDTSNVQRQAASEQYITVYKSNTSIPSFPNCTNFFQETNDKRNSLLAGFQQYLTSSTNNSIKVEALQKNAGEFLSWFIQYQGDITKKNYVNYLQSTNSDQPWDVNLTLSSKTLVNHWNVIIICGFIFSLLIIVPIVVVIIRKKKYLK